MMFHHKCEKVKKEVIPKMWKIENDGKMKLHDECTKFNSVLINWVVYHQLNKLVA